MRDALSPPEDDHHVRPGGGTHGVPHGQNFPFCGGAFHVIFNIIYGISVEVDDGWRLGLEREPLQACETEDGGDEDGRHVRPGLGRARNECWGGAIYEPVSDDGRDPDGRGGKREEA